MLAWRYFQTQTKHTQTNESEYSEKKYDVISTFFGTTKPKLRILYSVTMEMYQMASPLQRISFPLNPKWRNLFGGWNVCKGWGKGTSPTRREQQGREGDESERVKISCSSWKWKWKKSCSQVINELIEDLTKLDLVGERIPLTRMHNNNKERRHEVNTNTKKYK